MSYILTLQIDAASQVRFNDLRQRFFPPDRNFIDAHVTLFHSLPEDAGIIEILTNAAALPKFQVAVTGLRSLGKGVAYTLESQPLQTLHKNLSTNLADHLIPQDRQRFQPHIVVQNKVTPAAAKLLLQQLRASFVPVPMEATGLSLWHYRNGPWKAAQTFLFS